MWHGSFVRPSMFPGQRHHTHAYFVQCLLAQLPASSCHRPTSRGRRVGWHLALLGLSKLGLRSQGWVACSVGPPSMPSAAMPIAPWGGRPWHVCWDGSQVQDKCDQSFGRPLVARSVCRVGVPSEQLSPCLHGECSKNSLQCVGSLGGLVATQCHACGLDLGRCACACLAHWRRSRAPTSLSPLHVDRRSAPGFWLALWSA